MKDGFVKQLVIQKQKLNFVPETMSKKGNITFPTNCT